MALSPPPIKALESLPFVFQEWIRQLNVFISKIISATVIDAKGDLIVGTANDTVSRLGVGANGTVLTADSAETSGLKWATASISGVPTGAILSFGGTSAPTGYLLCDGSNVSRTTYSALFTAIGTTWGAGDGSTTFGLPDMRRRTFVGSGGTGTGTLGNAVGNTGGEESHALSTGELASHTHTFTTGGQSADHTHSGTTSGQSADHTHTTVDNIVVYEAGGALPGGTFGNARTEATGGSSNDHTHTITTGGVSAGHTHSGTSDATGSGTAHNTIQPSAVILAIIKT
jgi:microcystin-dependent protein